MVQKWNIHGFIPAVIFVNTKNVQISTHATLGPWARIFSSFELEGERIGIFWLPLWGSKCSFGCLGSWGLHEQHPEKPRGALVQFLKHPSKQIHHDEDPDKKPSICLPRGMLSGVWFCWEYFYLVFMGNCKKADPHERVDRFTTQIYDGDLKSRWPSS